MIKEMISKANLQLNLSCIVRRSLSRMKLLHIIKNYCITLKQPFDYLAIVTGIKIKTGPKKVAPDSCKISVSTERSVNLVYWKKRIEI